MLAYRVLTPLPPDDEKDLFDQTVLEFCKYGIREAESIAEMMCLEVDLVSFILKRLREHQFIDELGRLSTKGFLIWTTRKEQWVRVKLVTSFRIHGLTKSGPAFCRTDYLPYEIDPTGSTYIMRGTTGKPHRDYAMKIALEDLPQEKFALAKDRIVEAARIGRQIQKNYSHDWDSTLWEDSPSSATSINHEIKKVSILDDGVPHYVLSYLYVSDIGDWHVADPLGYGESLRLRKSIEQQMHKIPPLKSFLDTQLRNIADEGLKEWEKAEKEIKKRATSELSQRMGEDFDQNDVYDDLLNLEIAWIKVKKAGENCSQLGLNSVLLQCRRSVETVLRALYLKYPINWQLIDPKSMFKTNQAAAQSLGFSEIEPLLKVKYHEMKNCYRSLRVLQMSLIISSHLNHENPFYQISREEPSILSMIREVADFTNPAMHSNNEPTEFDDVMKSRKTTYRLIKIFSENCK